MEEAKAQDSGEQSSWGWWNSVVSSIKTTAEKVVEIYKEDLQEFAGNISEDTGKAIEDVKHSELVEKAIAVASSYEANKILSQVVDAISDDKSSSSSVSTPATRLEAKILEVQKDIGTYCTSPSEAAFDEFCKNFSSKEREKVGEGVVLVDSRFTKKKRRKLLTCLRRARC